MMSVDGGRDSLSKGKRASKMEDWLGVVGAHTRVVGVLYKEEDKKMWKGRGKETERCGKDGKKGKKK